MNKNQQMISVEPDVTIVVKAHGNLDVQGWERSEVGIVTDINVQKIRHENKLLRMLFVEDCELSIPQGGRLIVERVSGNARLRNLTNQLTVNKVQGNLAIQNVQTVSISRVADDCILENIEGVVEVGRIGENLKGKNLHSAIKVERVSGNIKLHSMGGKLDLRSEENIEISLTDQNHDAINLRASDNILLHLPVNPNAALQIKSSGEHIELSVGDYQKKINENRCEIRLGDGSQKIVLDSGNRVRVTGENLDENELLRLFEEMDVLWAKLKEDSEARRAARAQQVNWEIKMVEGAAKVAQEALNGVGVIAGQITEEAIVQAEQHVQEALRRVEEQIRNLGYDVWVGSEKSTPENETSDVTEEEKLIVMRLLQQHKISVEEADRLLEVLSVSSH